MLETSSVQKLACNCNFPPVLYPYCIFLISPVLFFVFLLIFSVILHIYLLKITWPMYMLVVLNHYLCCCFFTRVCIQTCILCTSLVRVFYAHLWYKHFCRSCFCSLFDIVMIVRLLNALYLPYHLCYGKNVDLHEITKVCFCWKTCQNVSIIRNKIQFLLGILIQNKIFNIKTWKI